MNISSQHDELKNCEERLAYATTRVSDLAKLIEDVGNDLLNDIVSEELACRVHGVVPILSAAQEVLDQIRDSFDVYYSLVDAADETLNVASESV